LEARKAQRSPQPTAGPRRKRREAVQATANPGPTARSRVAELRRQRPKGTRKRNRTRRIANHSDAATDRGKYEHDYRNHG